jgi:hypothetical protein
MPNKNSAFFSTIKLSCVLREALGLEINIIRLVLGKRSKSARIFVTAYDDWPMSFLLYDFHMLI